MTRLINWPYVRQVGPVRWAWRYGWRLFNKRVLGRDMVMRLPTGLPIVLPRASRYATEVWVGNADVDWGSEALLARYMDREAAFIDVGANIGYYTLYMAPLAGRVIAFEPDPSARAMLERNVAAVCNVEVVPMAVYRRASSVRFVQRADCERSHLAGSGTEPGDTVIDVPAVSLDGLMGDRPERVGAIKIDVEGQEIAVLDGAEAVVRRDQPLILSEYSLLPNCHNPAAENTPEALARWLGRHGYALYGFVRDGARRPSLRKLDAHGTRAAQMLFLVPPRLQAAFAARAGA